MPPDYADPAAARFDAAVKTAVLLPLAVAFGFVAAGLVASWGSPVGWLIIVAATIVGLVPLVIWSRRRSVLADAAPTGDPRIDGPRARLRALAEAQQPGAVRDHLVGILYEVDRVIGEPAHAMRERDELVGDLHELLVAAESLVATATADADRPLQRQTDLTRAFERALREASEGPDLREPSSAAVAPELEELSADEDDGDSRSGRGSTIAH